MKAVILAGGQGTRVRPYTFIVPKPLLPVGDKPVLQLIIEHLRRSDIRDIVISIGYRGELIRAYFRSGQDYDVDITYLEEPRELGTAGPLSLVRDQLQPGEHFLLMNGDILTKLDVRRIIETHGASDVALGVKLLQEQSPYGVLSIRDGQLVRVDEKPVNSFYINAGIYLLSERVLKDIPSNRYYTMPDLLNARVANGQRVDVFYIDEPWLALESPQHLEAANRDPQYWATPGGTTNRDVGDD